MQERMARSKADQFKETMSPGSEASEKLSQAIRLVQEARDIKMEEAKGQMKEGWRQAQDQISRLRHSTQESYSQIKEQAQHQVERHPLASILTVGFLGVLLGMIFSSSKK